MTKSAFGSKPLGSMRDSASDGDGLPRLETSMDGSGEGDALRGGNTVTFSRSLNSLKKNPFKDALRMEISRENRVTIQED